MYMNKDLDVWATSAPTCGESHCPRLMKHSNICSSTIMIGHRDWVTCSLPPMLFKPAVYNPGNHCDEQRHANDDAHDEPCERAAVLVLVVPTTAMFTGKLVILVDAERLLGEHLCNAQNILFNYMPIVIKF